MNEIPNTGEEARQMLAGAERVLADLNNRLNTAVIDHALAVGRNDTKAAEKTHKVARGIQAKLPAARDAVTFLKDMSERLAYADARLARDKRLARWKEIQPEAAKSSKLLANENAEVVAAARKIIEASKSRCDAIAATRELRSEYDALYAEFGEGDRLEWSGLDYWRIEVTPELTLQDVLARLRGRKRGERTNRAISPLRTIDTMAKQVRKAK
jgi:hypothetical protein